MSVRRGSLPSQILYPRNAEATLDPQLFRSPSSAYRGTPFWAWNTHLERAQLLRQLETFARMGFGGVHIHPRTGLATEYLGDAFMEQVHACVGRAQELGLKVWLYDEDRWPSGFAGGLVTQDPALRARHLLFTPTPDDGQPGSPSLIAGAFPGRSGNGILLARYHVSLEAGRLHRFCRLREGETPQADGRVWYAYLETALPSPWFNGQTYLDTLNPRAVQRFLELTHERYRAVLGEHFGDTIPAIFTDEPQFAHKGCLSRPEALEEVVVPWTPDLAESYCHTYGEDLLERLPELFWELPGDAVSLTRYRYHDHVAERFACAYADQVGAWCEQHSLLLTGHMMEEPTLHAQTSALGEAMRSYRAFHLPGIDVLCNAREYTTAKQAQSAARQFGRPGVASELYGVTNWDFDFAGHKAQGDWQAALGVTVRVPHLAWVSMAGEAKRDYPAPIGEQSPWHAHYPLVEDHFARLGTALSRGTPVVRLGVIHPVESYWLHFGPLEQTRLEREQCEQRFTELTEWLLFGLHDFDFISESLLPGLCPEHAGAPLAVGEARYDAVIVPDLMTVRSSTLERLERFADAGGRVIFLGSAPQWVDAQPDHRALRLAARCDSLPWSRAALMRHLEGYWEVRAAFPTRDRLTEQGTASLERLDALLCHLRQDGASRVAFFCNTDPAMARNGVRLAFRGRWHLTELDTLSGEMRPLGASVHHGETHLTWDFPAHGHLLVRLEPGEAPVPLETGPRRGWQEVERLHGPVPITLSEPNVLLLDQAEHRLNDGPWQPPLELLRLDQQLRSHLGWPLRMEALAQPWARRDPAPRERLTLRFRLRSSVHVASPRLALENARATALRLDGLSVATVIDGWWVDQSLETVLLPSLEPGTHLLELEFPYGPGTDVEWAYLLGDFGVQVQGAAAQIIAPVRQLCFGDWTCQGLPFYAGNVTYHAQLRLDAPSELAVQVPHSRAPLVTARLEGGTERSLGFAPHLAELGAVSAGVHTLDLTAYGNRVNAFGPVHLMDPRWRWFGPNSWRTVGEQWSPEYQLRPSGVLSAPRLLSTR